MVGAIDGMDVMGKDEGANEESAGAIASATTEYREASAVAK